MKFIALLIICAMLTSCGGGTKIIPLMDNALETESDFNSLKEQGDREFAKMYYMGWYNAVNFYKKALEIKKSSTELKEKLFFTYFLKALREPLYFIDNSESIREVHHWADELNRSLPTKNPFFGIVGFLLGEKEPTSPEITLARIREVKNNTDTDYKYFLYLKYAGLRMDILERQKEADLFFKRYPSTNLRYFAYGQFNDMNITMEKYPDFFELLLVRGDLAYQTKDLDNARRDYLKVIEIYRGIPPALYGIGNVYYDVGLIQIAMEYYEEAFKTSKNHFAALFKKGVCLHELGKYYESNIVMDIVGKYGMFEKGEAFYYKALNYFNLKNYYKVEENIKIAESLVPDSFRLNILAGLFYYQSDRYAESRLYFQKAKEILYNYPECYYYPGLMDFKEKNIKTALKNFYLAATYYLSLLENEYQVIKSIDEKNYPSELKQQKKTLLEKRINGDATNTIQKLEIVLNLFTGSEKKEVIEIRKIVQSIKENYLLNWEKE